MTDWQRPRSCDSSACPEVRIGLTDVSLRFTSNPDNVAVATLDEWRTFIASAKAGELDVGE